MRVTVRTDAGQYAANMSAKADQLQKGVRATGRAIERVLKERADWYSTGPYKQSVLTRLDHPYARRHSYKSTTKAGRSVTRFGNRIGQKFPARINLQTGQFRAGWRTRRRSNQHEMNVSLYNVSDRTPWLTAVGTDRMVGRPVLNAIARETRERTKGMYGKALSRACSTKAATVGYRPSRGGVDLVGAFRRGYQMGLGAGAL